MKKKKILNTNIKKALSTIQILKYVDVDGQFDIQAARNISPNIIFQ